MRLASMVLPAPGGPMSIIIGNDYTSYYFTDNQFIKNSCMRIGIYTRSEDLKLPTINWLDQHDFDSFEIYSETVIDENEDVSQREQLNMLIYDIEMGHLDAVYVDVLKIISPIFGIDCL